VKPSHELRLLRTKYGLAERLTSDAEPYRVERWMSRIRITGLAIALVALIAASYGLGRRSSHSQTSGKTGRRVLYYVDPMHPNYRSDKPGIAPDCGMQLEPVYAEEIANASAASFLSPELPPGAVSIGEARQKLLGIRVAAVEKSTARRTVRVVGRVVPEDTRVYRINSGVDGFIRETYQDSVGIRVKKDQKLASYYAPDFVAAASGFLAANERVPGSVTKEGSRSIQNYADRLRNLGMSDQQIKRIAESRQLPESIDVVAPADGFILARNISPGQHFDHDMEFYRIGDLRQVWVVAEVFEQEARYLRPGGQAQITLSNEGRQLPARIADSLPQSEIGGGTVKLRLELENPGFLLRPEMLVDVELPVRLPPAVTVPLDALVDSGVRSRVYVERGEGIFEPREVETGWRFGERVQILHGVQPGERVVVAATFLVDSESRLRTPGSVPAPPGMPKIEKHASAAGHAATMAMKKKAKDPNCGMLVDTADSAASGLTLDRNGETLYFCSTKCKKEFANDPAGAASRRQGD
jgi:Cu(I)/Ag(I) efflux system membrane fusion protein